MLRDEEDDDIDLMDFMGDDPLFAKILKPQVIPQSSRGIEAALNFRRQLQINSEETKKEFTNEKIKEAIKVAYKKLKSGPIFIGENHFTSYGRQMVLELLEHCSKKDSGLVKVISIERPRKVAEGYNNLITTLEVGNALWQPENHSNEVYTKLLKLGGNDQMATIPMSKVVGAAHELGISIHFHDAPWNKEGNLEDSNLPLTSDEGVRERNISSGNAIREMADTNHFEGLKGIIVLAGSDHVISKHEITDLVKLSAPEELGEIMAERCIIFDKEGNLIIGIGL